MKSKNRISTFLPWLICCLGALFYSYEYFLRIAPSVMTADLSRYFHIEDSGLGNLSAYYYYIYTPMQIIAGVLIDRYGPRRILTLASLCCVIGSYLFAATSHLWVAEISRALIGFGSAFAFIGVLKLATIWLPPGNFAMFSGLATALGMIGAIAGNLFLTWIVMLFGWQDTIYLSGSFGIFIALLLGIFVRDKNHTQHDSNNDKNLTLSTVIKNMWHIIKNPQMWIIGLIGFFMYIPTSAFAELWGNPYLSSMHNLSSEETAAAISMIFAGWIFGSPFSGFISDTINRRNIILAINALISAILISIVLFIPGLSVYDIYALLFTFGLFSGSQAITFAIAKEINLPEASASAIAFTNMMVMLSGVIFQYLIGRFLDYLWNGQIQNGVQVFTNQNYQIVLSILPIGLVLASIFAIFFLQETYCGEKTFATNNFASER